MPVIAEGERSRVNDSNNGYPGTQHCLFFSTPLALGGLSSSAELCAKRDVTPSLDVV